MPIFTPEMIAKYAQTVQQDAPAPTLGTVGEANRSRFRKIGLPAMIGGNVADLATTLQAISSGRGHEANMVMGSSPVRIAATKATMTALEAFGLEKLAKKNPKAALATALTLGALGAGLAVHNSRVGR